MGVPTKSFAAIACVGPLLLGRVAPQYLLGNSFWITGIVVLFLQLLVYAIWSVVFYPKLFSPLRHLPHAPVSQAHPGPPVMLTQCLINADKLL